jgi:long-subunit acyl-CoA synthetase (AMP-forming)
MPPSARARHAILVGQDKRELGALLVADHDALAADGLLTPEAAAAAAAGALAAPDAARLGELLSAEAARALAAGRPDAPSWEHVARFAVVARPLAVADGTLTGTFKPRRAAVLEREAAAVAALMAQLRG